jgi:hypothetical protein
MIQQEQKRGGWEAFRKSAGAPGSCSSEINSQQKIVNISIMVTHLTTPTPIAKFPSYNAEYVTQVKAKFIGDGSFLKNQTNIASEERPHRFCWKRELSVRSHVKM